jgi:hypothetical protein
MLVEEHGIAKGGVGDSLPPSSNDKLAAACSICSVAA